METSTSCTAAFRAKTLASQVKELVLVIVIGKLPGADFGERCTGSFAKLNHDGLWLKTSGGFCQSLLGMVEEEGDLEMFSETYPNWGIVLDGVAMEPMMLEQFTSARGFLLLPTPVASDSNGGAQKVKRTPTGWVRLNHTTFLYIYNIFTKKFNFFQFKYFYFHIQLNY